VESRPRIWPPLLDWHDRKAHWDDIAYPCILCRQPTNLVSDKGKPTHKACAEAWYEQHPEVWVQYEAERDARAVKARAARAATGSVEEVIGLF
jgi:hypothetical protein